MGTVTVSTWPEAAQGALADCSWHAPPATIVTVFGAVTCIDEPAFKASPSTTVKV